MKHPLRTYFLFFLLLTLSLHAQTNGSISGRVTSVSGAAVERATVTLVETNQSVTTGSNGAFTFSNLLPGSYHLAVEAPRLGATVVELVVAAGATAQATVVVDRAVHREEIVVTANPLGRGSSEVAQPVNVIAADELAQKLQPTLGETLAGEPGVSSTFFGTGSSRPVIRGLGGDRIRILQEGVGTGDASNVSPDHAVTADPASAERIEIVRGPATLLFGSNAIGGVVNVLDNRVPSSVPSHLTGRGELRFGSVANEKSGSASFEGGRNAFAWHLDLLARETGDYAIPGAAHAEEEDEEAEEEGAFGTVPNSATESAAGTIGASWVGSRGFFGAALNLLDSRYGIPAPHHHHGDEEEEPGEEGVEVDLQQRRLDIRGELNPLGGFVRHIRMRAGRTDYEHAEIEGGTVGTRFTNEAWEGRVEATHRALGALTGAFGVQLMNRDFAAIGEEAFVPPSETSARAAFVFEELTRDRWTLQFGGRYEQQDVSTADPTLPDRDFAGFSSSVGAIWRPMADYAVAVSIARGVRAPTAEELYSNGPHLATASFEIGDPALQEEKNTGIDVSLRRTAGKLHGELNLFSNRFDGYVFGEPTNEEEDGLAVFQYAQRDAHFRGAELNLHAELWHTEPHHLELEISADTVRATLEGGGNLPRIPPHRFSAALSYSGHSFSLLAEVRHVASQRDVATFETPTSGYTMLNASVGYRFIASSRLVNEILVRGTNLSDVLARSHTSPLKSVAPLPGRDVTVSWRVTF